MKTLEELLNYLKRHKNTPDLHSAVVVFKDERGDTFRSFIDYQCGCFSCSTMNGPDINLDKQEALNYFAGYEILSYEI